MELKVLLAGVAFSAYRASCGGRSVTGQALPTWTEVNADVSKARVVQAWMAAAEAVVQANDALLMDGDVILRKGSREGAEASSEIAQK